VKSEDLRPLFERAQKMSKAFDSFRIEHVYREQNREADALVNEALDETEGGKPKLPAIPRSESSAKSESSSKSAPPSSQSEPRKIQARFRGGVLYLLEDVELPDGMVVDVSIHLRPKPIS
jgi:hypothetical protein